MKFRDHLNSEAGLESLLSKLQDDLKDMVDLNTTEYIIDELLKGTKKTTTPLEWVIYEYLTGNTPENYEYSDKDHKVDEKAYQKKIEELKDKNPKFKSICIRMALALENIKKAKKK